MSLVVLSSPPRPLPSTSCRIPLCAMQHVGRYRDTPYNCNQRLQMWPGELQTAVTELDIERSATSTQDECPNSSLSIGPRCIQILCPNRHQSILMYSPWFIPVSNHTPVDVSPLLDIVITTHSSSDIFERLLDEFELNYNFEYSSEITYAACVILSIIIRSPIERRLVFAFAALCLRSLILNT
jgi:hypothetical protein